MKKLALVGLFSLTMATLAFAASGVQEPVLVAAPVMVTAAI